MESKKADMKEILDTCAQAVGANGKVHGGYPAWEYKVDSELRKVMVETFVEQYGKNRLYLPFTPDWSVDFSLERNQIWIVYLWDRIFWIFIPLMRSWILPLHREHGNT